MTMKRRVYRFIRDYARRNGYAPTYQEVADALGISMGGVSRYVGQLRRMRVLQPGTRRMRCLKVVA